ncbi:MAG: PAS domain S-box protein [Patescibacteria group bacterium]
MKLAIAERKEIATGTIEVAFNLSGKEFHFQAGQYVWITLQRLFYNDEHGQSRCFSIASSPNDKKFLRIAFRVSQSGFKRTLGEIALGSEVEVEGPFGDMVLPDDHSLPIVFVAGGIGITPFLSMLRFAAEEKIPYNITLLYANRNPESVVYLKELEELARQNANFILRNHFDLLDAPAIQKNINEGTIKTALWYIVGPPAMATETEKIIYKLGVSRGRTRLTEFNGYSAPVATGEKIETLAGLSEAVLRALDKNVLVSITDLRGTIIYANDKFVETSKYSREELIGRNHRILKSGFHRVLFYQELWHTISTGHVWRGEIKNRAKDGSFYWVDANIAPIFGKENEAIGYIAIRFLITERKKLEEKLEEDSRELKDTKAAILNVAEDLEREKESVERKVVERTRELKEEQARLIASINSLKFGFIVADPAHRILLKNQAVAKILGIPEESVTMVKISGILEGTVNLLERSERCIAEKQNFDLPEVLFGSKFLKILISPIVMIRDHNEVIGYVLLLEDITEAKILERSRDEFFSIASHELRTPLTAIQGNASMLLDFYADKIKDPEVKQMLGDISTAGHRLIKIVNDFLELSRFEQKRMKFEAKPFAVHDLADEVVKELKGLADKKGLELRFDPPAVSPPNVLADRDKIKEVLINLTGNAINYTKTGSIVIGLELVGKMLKVKIKDTGIGISPVNQGLLFRKFQQAGDVLARDVTQGTGLGLYISKLIIEAMGGVITIDESIPGKGSTFSFSLPIAAA